MKFVYPSLVILLLIQGLTMLFALAQLHRKNNALRKQWGIIHRSALTTEQRFRKRLQQLCLLIGGLCFSIAVARPQWGFRLEKRQHQGTNVLFAIDVSKSMLASDVRPNRLELAKMSILDLLKSLNGAHIGLIAFAGNAFLQCPPTTDLGAIKSSLQILDTQSVQKGGTNLSAPLQVAKAQFEKIHAKHNHLLLLTDGEDLSNTGKMAAQIMQKNHIVVHTIGIGTSNGSTITITDKDGHQQMVTNKDGAPVISRLDVDTLQTIAKTTKGFYAPLGNAGEGLQRIYQTALKNLPKENFESVERMPVERYPWFAAIALLLLTLEPLLYSFKPLKRLFVKHT
jgi:Ca-activated chloride channel family protein